MRLRQLARKLEVKPAEIQSFLEKEHSVIVEDGPNVKLEDEHVELVRAAFEKEEEAPEEQAEENATDSEELSEEVPSVEEETVEEETVEEELPTETVAEVEEDTVPEVEEEFDFEAEYVEDNLPSADDIEEDDSNDLNQDGAEDDEDSEVIKAPTVELPGVTVVGKIDLPEEVEREMPMVEIDGVMRAARPRRRDDKRKRRKPGEIRKPRSVKGARKEQSSSSSSDVRNDKYLSDAEKEAMEKERLRLKAEKDKQEKERRKKHYKAKHAKEGAPVKKKTKAVQKKEEEASHAAQEQQEAPKTTLGKVWRWFNT